MTKELFSNFATSLLAGSTAMTTTTTIFAVTAGQGALFPSTNFLVTIDTEIIFIVSRAIDTFTIASNGRGFDGTQASIHNIGAIVQGCVISYNFGHLWQNVPDTFLPDVPPVQNQLSTSGTESGVASIYDTEFETQGNWILYPPSGTSTFSVGTDYRSHLFFNRSANDKALYTAYLPFTDTSTGYVLTCKVSDAVSLFQNINQSTETTLFVSDQSNPVASHDTGNRMRIDIVTTTNADTSTNIISNNRVVRVAKDVSGVFSRLSPYLAVSPAVPLYLRLHYNNAGIWRLYVGDGWTYNLLVAYSNFAFAPQSFGFQFYTGTIASSYTQHMAMVDFCRYTPTTAPPHFPSS